jgi:small-conductance mechanosensitive channel
MKIPHSPAILGLLLFVLLGIVGLILTRDTGQPSSSAQLPGHRTPLVDEQPLQTARQIAKLASNWDEFRLAQQALKLADHEVDLAFADALRDATEHPPTPTPQSRELYARVAKAQALVQSDQNRIDDLKKKLAAASNDNQKSNVQQQLDFVQAQVELDQDELDDAKEDLSRSGLDPLSRIQRQFNRHEAEQQADTSHAQVSPGSPTPAYADNLMSRVAAWRAAHSKITQLANAQNDAIRNAATLSQQHDDLEKKVTTQKAGQQAITQQALAEQTSAPSSTAQAQNSPVAPDTAAALQSLHAVSVNQKDLSDLDKRVQDHSELRDTYANWIVLVKSDQLAAVHGILKSALTIVIILLALYLAGLLAEHFLSDLTPEQTRFRTLRIIVHFALRAVGFALILLVIFGVPSQLSTVLGLAGAGLTVALQDFIISFLGWFVLMGRNGMRVGDWVEINGVAGEVMEIGLLRTVLLETGNWAEAGHPTGRKVAMMNSYAIQGHFFNFSTSGQWLWDEIQVTVPAAEDPYPVITAIRQMVVKETEAETRAAEQEWKQATNRYRVEAVSAEPAVNLRPTGAGVEVHVRYITHANERYATRTRLYQAVVDLLHRRGLEAEAAQAVPAVSGKS